MKFSHILGAIAFVLIIVGGLTVVYVLRQTGSNGGTLALAILSIAAGFATTAAATKLNEFDL